MAQTEEFDVAILGAGLSGIAFARFYLDVHPECRLIILEKQSEIGGTWSKSRVFDTFWTQSALRLTSLADIPLTLGEGVPNVHDSFPSKYVNQYLEDYVQSHVYNGRPLRDRIRLNSEVTSVERSALGGWTVRLKQDAAATAAAAASSIRCARLAFASGLTSQPSMPRFPRHPDWKAPILHHRDYGVHSKAFLSADSPYKHLTIIGGGKSAADMVYACVQSDKHVSWVIRKSGEGPGVLISPAPPVGKYRSAAEMPFTRNSTKFNPSAFRPLAAEVQAMHASEEGRAALAKQVAEADSRSKAWADYQGREGALPGFRELEPTTSLFWSSGPPGMMQHGDFWEAVSRRVDVYHGDVVGSTADALRLDDGRSVPTDLLLAGTGWNPGYPFLTPQQERDFGLPHDPRDDPPDDAAAWRSLFDEADRRILRQYPILATPPPDRRALAGANGGSGGGSSGSGLTPARLYQGIAPLGDPSVVFLGRARMSNGFIRAEAQAIWATAYWDGAFKMPPAEEARAQVAFMNAFSRRRYPYGGGDGVNFHKDIIWYVDGLLSEAGLESHRKAWWDDWSEPWVISDMKDCKEEYLEKKRRAGEANGLNGVHVQ